MTAKETARPEMYRYHNGGKSPLPFEAAEYEARLAELRERMEAAGATAAVFTSMHNIAYYSGFLYCSFGRPYAQVVTATDTVTFSAGIDAAPAGPRWRASTIRAGEAPMSLAACPAARKDLNETRT